MLKKEVKKLYQSYLKFSEYRNKSILNGNEGNLLLKNLLGKEEALMVTRIGSTELEILSAYQYNEKKYNDYLKNKINVLSGVFPPTDNTLNEFSEIFLNALSNADIIGVWFNKNEGKIIEDYCRSVNLVELRSLEPYYWDSPWSQMLYNKTVLVIHPFIDSIEKQLKNRDNLFENKEVLPNFELKTLRAVQSAGGSNSKFSSWIEALNYMYEEIDKIDFDVAIIGAGAYGLPLAGYIKEKGKKAIHMGGSSQILFGIKGVRWDNHPFISTLYNEYWARPMSQEHPTDFKSIEKGCYW
ncbi:hypothetical protein ACQKGA_07945 [Priestia megaterium]|uniref:GT-D fold domain-containing protein n=1 Tax=Priestia megaterium TaxID=1404 RepID=UPI00190C848D|nr:hypothetical protein [Bacillus sp. S35]